MTEPQELDSVSSENDADVSIIVWPLLHRILFRFIFAYVVLFMGSFSGAYAPLSLPLATLFREFWSAIIPWVANSILHVPPPPVQSDGDGLGHWIIMVGSGVFAVVVTVIWSVADRRRLNYLTLHAWFRIILRYSLGISMFTYGVVKIFHLQMLPPHLSKLVQSYGDSSPTSLLWIFMGSSAAYSAFTGVVELIGGLLLFNRRSATLGALISFCAMAHVVALNFSYDVSVKIWSMNLLALSVILIVPDFRRLVDVLVLNRPSKKVEFPPLFKTQKKARIWFGIGMACLAITLGLRLFGVLNGRAQSYSRTPVALYGIYEVESFKSDGNVLPPLLTDESRWRMLIIERSGLASIRFMNDEHADYLTRMDDEGGTISFVPNFDVSITAAGGTRQAYNPRQIERRFERAIESNPDSGQMLKYTQLEDLTLDLTGSWDGSVIEVRLRRIDESKFLLLNRGFHWIQEYPFFR